MTTELGLRDKGIIAQWIGSQKTLKQVLADQGLDDMTAAAEERRLLELDAVQEILRKRRFVQAPTTPQPAMQAYAELMKREHNVQTSQFWAYLGASDKNIVADLLRSEWASPDDASLCLERILAEKHYLSPALAKINASRLLNLPQVQGCIERFWGGKS